MRMQTPPGASGASFNGISYPAINGMVTVPEKALPVLQGFGFSLVRDAVLDETDAAVEAAHAAHVAEAERDAAVKRSAMLADAKVLREANPWLRALEATGRPAGVPPPWDNAAEAAAHHAAKRGALV